MLITWQPFHQPVEENLQHPPNTLAPEKKLEKQFLGQALRYVKNMYNDIVMSTPLHCTYLSENVS